MDELKPSDWMPVIDDQLRMHAGMDALDWYKLAHQAVFGGAHASLERDAVLRGIQREWGRGIRTVPFEQMIEMIHPYGHVVRLNIRLFERNGGSPETLADQFINSWLNYTPQPMHMDSFLPALLERIRQKEHPDSVEKIETLWESMKAKAYPAATHSQKYRDQYRPSYRVILKSMLTPFS